MNAYSCDFETNVYEHDCRVWAWGCQKLYDRNNFEYGNTIEGFLNHCKFLCKNENATVYFHNLKFDGEFILSYILDNKWEWVEDTKSARSNTFTTLISGEGIFYSIELFFYVKGRRRKSVKIINSLNILPMTVKAVAESFGLPIKKGEIDYKTFRKVGHTITDEELDYLKNDCDIIARALEIMFDKGLDCMTQGSSALKFYKNLVGKNFDRWFPKLTPLEDYEIRLTYKGGWTYCDDRFSGRLVGDGLVYDVNSLYPSIMACVHGEILPFGKPVKFEGEYVKDEKYPLYTIAITCSFEIKKNHLPTIQIKSGRFVENEYLKSSGGEEVDLYLTNVDFELFLEHYDVYNLEFHGGYKFQAGNTMFVDYINYWTVEKIKAKKEGNKGMYKLSKLMLNALYGKFATSLVATSKKPYLKHETTVGYQKLPDSEKDGLYIPIGAFITSYCRAFTIRTAQKVYDRFMYADTDSIHILGLEEPDGIDIDSYRLGAWDNELVFSQAKYLRQKCYMEYGHEPNSGKPDKWKVTCAGLPEKQKEKVTIDIFDYGMEIDGKLMPKHVNGGLILIEKTFTIKNPFDIRKKK